VAACALVVVLLAGCVPSSRYGPLQTQWTTQTGGVIASKPAVDGDAVLVGSWDGYEYSYDVPSGALRWRTNLGQTFTPCAPGTYGVTSSPWLEGGVAYLGGGDSNWYALEEATGRVLWTIPTDDANSNGGNYNWSSPAVYNSHAYVGIASLCDFPLVQGKLLRVNLASHQVENVWKAVPDGQRGGAIWTSPVVDAARNTVFVTTGTRVDDSQQYAQAIVALDAATLAVKSSWALPLSDPTPDADWGTSPTLFTDSRGRDLVAAINKNGILYAFRRDDLRAGPVWQTRIARGGPSPDNGDGSVSTGFFDGKRLYYAGGSTTIGGASYPGSVRAVDPATGTFLWERGLGSLVFGALTGANGMISVPALTGLHIVDASTGEVLYGNDLGDQIYAASTIVGGRLFLGDIGGAFHAFAFPAAPGAASGQSAHLGRVAVLARCTVLGQLPRRSGRAAIERIVLRVTGRQNATLSAYTNRRCSGRPAVRIRLANGRATLRFDPPRTLSPATPIAVASSRPVRLVARIKIRFGWSPGRRAPLR